MVANRGITPRTSLRWVSMVRTRHRGAPFSSRTWVLAFCALLAFTLGCSESGSDGPDAAAQADIADAGLETRRSLCGNGRYNPGEECDDGNTYENDGCTAACRVAEGVTA